MIYNNNFNSRFPLYNDDSDYQTNAPSYYDDLARVHKLLKYLGEKIGFYDKELEKRFKEWDELIKKFPQNVEDLLKQWLKDGTLEKIINENIFKDLHDKVEQVRKEMQNILDKFNRKSVQYFVGDNQEFKEVQDVIELIEKMGLQPYSIKINIVKPYTLKKQVVIKNMNMSHVEILGDDINVQNDNFKTCYVIPNAKENYETVPTFYIENSFMPIFNVNLSLTDKIDEFRDCVRCKSNLLTGIYLNNSRGFIVEEKQISKFTFYAVILANSDLTAHGVRFNTNGNRSELTKDNYEEKAWGGGVLAITSRLLANKSWAHYNGDCGFNISQGSTASLNGSMAMENGHHALLVTSGSSCSFRHGDAGFTIDDILVAYAGSHIDARYSSIRVNQINYGVIATRNSTINFEGGSVDNCQYGLMANRGSTIDATNTQIHNASENSNSEVFSDTVRSALGSTVILTNATVSCRSKGDLLQAENGGKIICNRTSLYNNGDGKTTINCYGGEIYGRELHVGSGKENTILATRGGKVTILESTIIGNSNIDNETIHAYDGEIDISNSTINGGYRNLVATRGGRINAYDCTINGNEDMTALSYGAYINMKDIKIHGGGEIQATQGGAINIVNGSTTGNNINCYNGGQIYATDFKENGRLLSLSRMNIKPNTMDTGGKGFIIYNNITQ